MICPPSWAAPRAQAPMTPVFPPPKTKPKPDFARQLPSFFASDR